MKIEYDYTDSRRPPENYSVTIETLEEAREVVGLLLARELNNGMATHELARLSETPRFVRRR